MKSLGAILCVALMMVPFVGTSAPAQNESLNNPYVVDAMRVNEEITGQHVDHSNAVLLGTSDFTLPTGAIGVLANMDAMTGEFTVVPVWTTPDTDSASGCIITGSTVGYGYHPRGPVAIGDYNSGCPFNGANFYQHPGGISSETLVCIQGGTFCYVYTYGFSQQNFQFAYMYVFCQFASLAAGIQTPPPPNGPTSSIISNGVCSAYGFASNGFNNPAINRYALTYVYPPAGATAAGLVNWV